MSIFYNNFIRSYYAGTRLFLSKTDKLLLPKKDLFEYLRADIQELEKTMYKIDLECYGNMLCEKANTYYYNLKIEGVLEYKNEWFLEAKYKQCINYQNHTVTREGDADMNGFKRKLEFCV